MAYTEARKRAIHKWVEANREKYNEYQILKEKNWRLNNPDKYRAKNKRGSTKQYQWLQISKLFRHI